MISEKLGSGYGSRTLFLLRGSIGQVLDDGEIIQEDIDLEGYLCRGRALTRVNAFAILEQSSVLLTV